MNKPIDVFVLRHAVPLDTGLDDPGIAAEQRHLIHDTAELIAGMAEKNAEFTVYTSPREAAIQTGNVLWYNDNLQMTQGRNPVIHDDLSDRQTPAHPEAIKSRWPSMLREMSGRAIMRTAADKNTGLIIVTHEPVMRAFPAPELLSRTDHLAVNHLKDYQDLPSDKVIKTSLRTDRLFHNGRALQSMVHDFMRENPEFLDENKEPSQELLDKWNEISADLQAMNKADLEHHDSSQQ